VSSVAPKRAPGETPEAVVKVESGRIYRINVSGKYFAGDGIYADAKYSSRYKGPWTDVVQAYESQGAQLLDLQIYDPEKYGFVSPDWGPFSPDHKYSVVMVAKSERMRMRIFDPWGNNNKGGLRVDICATDERHGSD
jgi:hypothetical protein